LSPILHVRSVFPLQAAYPCPPLPHVIGFPVSRVLWADLTPGWPSASLLLLGRGSLPGYIHHAWGPAYFRFRVSPSVAHCPYPHAFPGANRASQVPSVPFCTCRALCRPRQTLGELTKTLSLCWLLEPLRHRHLHHPRYRGCIKTSGSAVSPAACAVPCVRFTCSVRRTLLLPLAPPRQMQHSVRVAG